jgi:hypothetical protein
MLNGWPDRMLTPQAGARGQPGKHRYQAPPHDIRRTTRSLAVLSLLEKSICP